MFLGKTNYEEAKGGWGELREGGKEEGRCGYLIGIVLMEYMERVKRQTKMRSVLVLVWL